MKSLAQRFRVGKFLPSNQLDDPEFEQQQRVIAEKSSGLVKLLAMPEFESIQIQIKEREEELITQIQNAKNDEKLTGLSQRLDEIRRLVPGLYHTVAVSEKAARMVEAIEERRRKKSDAQKEKIR